MAPRFISTDSHLWVLHVSQGNLIHIRYRLCWVPSAFLVKHCLLIYSNGFMPSMCKHHIICLWYVVYMVYIGVSRFPVLVTTQWSVAKVEFVFHSLRCVWYYGLIYVYIYCKYTYKSARHIQWKRRVELGACLGCTIFLRLLGNKWWCFIFCRR